MSDKAFVHSHFVQFYETDLMGIVHHANYLKFCEEARVGWAHLHGLLDYQKVESAFHLAVIETQVKHLKPCTFGDTLLIEVRVRMNGARMEFGYKMHRHEQLVMVAKTVHAALDKNLRLIRPPKAIKNKMTTESEKHPWTETWLLNL